MINNKVKKICIIIKKPSKILTFFIDKFGKKISYLFRNKSFFLQGQMDINPLSIWYKPEFISLTGGFLPKENSSKREIVDLEPWDNTRRDMLLLILRTILERNIIGEMAELGVYKGNTAKLIHKFIPERKLHLFDTFEGFTEKSVEKEKKHTGLKIEKTHFSDTNLKYVKENINPNENVFFYPGLFPQNLPKNFDLIKFAFVHLDADLFDPTYHALGLFYEKMVKSGIIVIHDYNSWPGARTAVDTFFKDKPEIPLPMPDKSGSVVIIKQ